MPLTATQRTRLNQFLIALGAKGVALEDAYHDGLEVVHPASVDAISGQAIPAVTRVRNRYWQGRRQVLGTLAVDDKPTDQAVSWKGVGVASKADLPDITGLEAMSIQIDVYDGPQGKGWTVTLTIAYAGTAYRRVYNRGPESYREQDW